MAAKLGVLVIHGVGSQEAGYSRPLRREVSERLDDRAGEVAWNEILWADVLRGREDELWECLTAPPPGQEGPLPLDFVRLRQFLLHNAGDAIAYQRDHAPETTYQQIHAVVSRAILELRAELDPGAPVVAVAHSLGAHILSNYVWDRQRGSERSHQKEFTPLDDLLGFVSLGAQIALFALAFPVARPIRLPGSAITEPRLVELSRWTNYYDQDDVLGWPVRGVYVKNEGALTSEELDTLARIEDREVDVGNLLTSWNPIAHGAYFTDGSIHRRLARYLDEILDALHTSAVDRLE